MKNHLLVLIICVGCSLCTAESFLFLFAHPDDDMYVHGNIADLVSEGKIVNVIYVTSGENGLGTTECPKGSDALKRLRESEARAAMNALNVLTSPYFLGYPDDNLEQNIKNIKTDIYTAIDILNPDVLITFPRGGITAHSAHTALNRAVTELFDSQTKASTLLQFCVSENRAKNILAPVTQYTNGLSLVKDNSVNIYWSCIGKKNLRSTAAKCYKSQFSSTFFEAWDTYINNADYEEFMIKGIKGTQLYIFKSVAQ